MDLTPETSPNLASAPKKDWADLYFAWLKRRRRWLNAAVALITVACLALASKLELRTDFSQLLPDNLPSVLSLKEASKRLGGTGLMIVGIGSPSFDANRKFMEALALRLKPMVGHELRYFEYRYTDVQSYLEKFAFHYLTVPQLKSINARITQEIAAQKDSAVGSFLGLGENKPASAPGVDIFGEVSIDPSLKKFLNYRDAYLSAEDGKIMAMALRPMGSSLDVQVSRALIAKMRGFIDALNPKSFHPQMRVDLSGNIPQTVEEFDSIKQDILATALLLTVLVLAVLYLFFWSWRVIFLLMANLCLAVAWTFGITQLAIGYLNTQTAFLGSLVVGTGINYGIIFFARFLELRRQNRDTESAIVQALRATTLTTFIAALTTSVSFAVLLTASNRGFSQFGFIGGIGIIFCWIAASSILPLWLNDFERRFPKRSTPHPLSLRFRKLGIGLGRFFIRRAVAIGIILGVLTLVLLPFFSIFIHDPLEYNFDNLRNKIVVSPELNDFRERVGQAFPTSAINALVMVNSSADAREICPAILNRAQALSPTENTIDSCLSVYSLIPPFPANPGEHQALLREVQRNLSNRLLHFSQHSDIIEALRRNMSFKPPTFTDIPPQIMNRFRELDGREGLFASVTPKNSKPLSDGRNLIHFTSTLTNVPLENTHHVVSASGDSFVLADLLRSVAHEGPRIALMAFVASLLIAVFLSGGWRAGVLMSVCLLLATWWMIGMQGLLGIKYNFFNFIALPLTFGIGIDYPINIFIRCRQDGFKDYGRVFAGSGMAVLLCSLTTIIGYYTLIGTTSQALASFGRIAILGEVSCLASALILVPILLRFSGRFKGPERS